MNANRTNGTVLRRLADVLKQLGEPDSTADSAEALRSRRNRLFQVKLSGGREIAVKLYNYPSGRLEYEVLQKLDEGGVAVPEPVGFGDDWLACEMVHGPTLMDLVNEGEKDGLIVEDLPRWLAEFHSGMAEGRHNRIKGDCNLRNFLAPAGGGLVGIDFEGFSYGRPVEDVAEACASLLSSNPPFTPGKLNLSKILIKNYREASGDGLEDLDKQVTRSLIESSKWRPNHREWLWRWAIQVEVWGLEDLARRAIGQ